MRVLIVASYNKNRFAPFIVEQAAALENHGCQIEWFGVARKGVIGYLRELPRLRKTIRAFHPDVIHGHYGLSCLLANMATRKIPVVSTYHGSDINNPNVLPFSRMAMRLSAWNIFVSRRMMEIAKPRKHYELLPCGIDLNNEQTLSRAEARMSLGWKSQDCKVLFAGAFDNEVKDPELAKRAIDDLRFQMSNLELVELKGYTREEVNKSMCAANCLLMTSKTEGSPQVIKEAMACGCPIVSVDVGDVAERTAGVDGCYVVSSREPKEIALALMKALAFKGETNGREKIVESGLANELVAKRIIAIYEDIIKK